MILGDPAPAAAHAPHGQSRMTLDEIFHRIALRRAEAPALLDPPNRPTFTDGAPRRLTYAEADHMVSAIAGRLRRTGLPLDSIVGIQLPNIAETILATLGVLRAGMIVAPLPLLWRRADATAALARVGAKALITCGRVGAFNHCHFGMRVAAEVFSIRYVCGFGDNLPDGVVPLDDLFAAGKLDSIPAPDRDRQREPAAHVAAVTFDVGPDGVVPVARNHSELLAGGLAVLLESRLAQESGIVSTLAPSSFGGICLTLLPWLLTGGALALHHPFDADVLARQWHGDEPELPPKARTLIVPGPVAFKLAEAGVFSDGQAAAVIAAWRSPDRVPASAAWPEAETPLVDVSIFGEAVLVPGRRGTDGRPSPLPFGSVVVPRDSMDGIAVAELARTESGTVASRGAMAPHHMFPPGIETSGLPHFRIGEGGFIDSGYPCRIDTVGNAMVVTGPPSGVVTIGGYRFPLRDLQKAVARVDRTATLAALPDPLVGQHLIGNAADREAMKTALRAAGVNPFVIAAFRDLTERGSAPAA